MILAIAERLNGTRKKVAGALADRDADFVRGEVDRQLAGGAQMIDINGGTSPAEEPGNLIWLAETVGAHTDAPLCIDSVNPEAIEAAIEILFQTRGSEIPSEVEVSPGVPRLMINSITAGRQRYDRVAPLVQKYNCAVIALCLGEDSSHSSAEQRIETGAELVGRLVGDGIETSRIYIDPLVLPLGADSCSGAETIKVLRELKQQFSGLRSVCGLSNVSFGLPARALINRTFLAMLIGAGLDAAVMDTADIKLMSTLATARALCGKDEYCASFISAYRKTGFGE